MMLEIMGGARGSLVGEGERSDSRFALIKRIVISRLAREIYSGISSVVTERIKNKS